MSDEQNQKPFPLEALVRGLDELRIVLGEGAVPGIEKVKAGLIEAMSERDKGNTPAAVACVSRAMVDLASLSDGLGQEEAQAMRMLTSAFTGALAADDRDVVEAGLQQIQQRAGTPKKDQH